MKKKFLNKKCKHLLLAVPAAALMLGATHAGTIGIHYTENFGQNAANGNGSNTGTYGTPGYYHYGYMTTGMNVTAPAFGVPAANWTNVQLPYGYAVNNTNIVGSMTMVTTAKVAQCSGIGNTNFVYATWFTWFMPAGVVPGNDEVTWCYLDDGIVVPGPNYDSMSYTMWNVKLSGMHAAHPNGYTIQTIGYPWLFDTSHSPPAPAVNISDSATFTNSMLYTDLGARQGAWGINISHAGLSPVSPVMTADVVNIYGDPPWVDFNGLKHPPLHHATLCGFIITDAQATFVPPTISISGTNIVWTGDYLLSSPALGAGAVWTTNAAATSPYPLKSPGAQQKFYRAKSIHP